MHRNVDLHLLDCLDALMAERQVTRAASRMEMSQPAMSNALARLRILFGDPLLVRTSQGMVPTRRALELTEIVRSGLRRLDEAFASGRPFDPALADQTIRIMTTDYAAEALMPGLLAKLSRDAPHLKVSLRGMSPSRLGEELQADESHLAIGYFQDMSKELYSSTILTEPIVCVAGRHHARLGDAPSLDEYARLRHAYFAGFPHSELSTTERITDTALAGLGIRRNVVFQSGSVLVILAVVAETDLVATIPLGAARRGVERLRLQVMPVPFPVPNLELSLIWHDRTHRDKAHRWVRAAIRGIARRQRLTQA